MVGACILTITYMFMAFQISNSFLPLASFEAPLPSRASYGTGHFIRTKGGLVLSVFLTVFYIDKASPSPMD